MNHIGGGGQDAHLLADRHHQRIIHLQQIMLALGGEIANLCLGGGKCAEKFDAIVQIIVLPAPLIAGDLDRQFGIAGIVHANQGAGGGNRHADQNHHRNNRPQHFDQGALVELGRHRAARFAVVVDRPEHDSEHHHADGYANPEDQHMQMVNIMADGGDALRHVQRQIGVRAHTPRQR